MLRAGTAAANRDSSLQSWASLSPPSNFELPEGFDHGLFPAAAAIHAGRQQPAAGPKDFSGLLAGMPTENSRMPGERSPPSLLPGGGVWQN